MAGAHRTQDHPVIDALLARSDSAAFFEVVRALQAMPQHADAVPVGHQGPASREGVRFRPPLDFSFGVNEIDGCKLDTERGRFELACRFFGLYGTASPLPAVYTELLLYEDPEGRLRDFLDIFNHRLISFVYRAWEKYRHAVLYDGRGDDPISRRVRILGHLERPGEPMALLQFAGLLHQQPMSETSLEDVLGQVLGVPVAVRSCCIRWIPVPQHQRNSLGERNCTLGGLCALGQEIRSAATTYGVTVGPLPRDAYLDFLPGGSQRAALCALLDRLVGDDLDCLIAIAIAPEEAQPYHLGSPHGGLGSTTWLGEDAAHRAHALGDTVSQQLYSSNPDSKVA